MLHHEFLRAESLMRISNWNPFLVADAAAHFFTAVAAIVLRLMTLRSFVLVALGYASAIPIKEITVDGPLVPQSNQPSLTLGANDVHTLQSSSSCSSNFLTSVGFPSSVAADVSEVLFSGSGTLHQLDTAVFTTCNIAISSTPTISVAGTQSFVLGPDGDPQVGPISVGYWASAKVDPGFNFSMSAPSMNLAVTEANVSFQGAMPTGLSPMGLGTRHAPTPSAHHQARAHPATHRAPRSEGSRRVRTRTPIPTDSSVAPPDAFAAGNWMTTVTGDHSN